MISFRDYEGVQGFGLSSMSDVAELNKALQAGFGTSPASQTGGGALRVESLEASLKVVTYLMRHIVLWQKIPKTPAYNTVEEFNRLLEYGADVGPGGGFINEGELPSTQDTDYARVPSLVKFLGTTREVTHPMTLVRPAHGDVIALETQNGIMWLLRQLELALFFGSSDAVFNPTAREGPEFDGLEKQIIDGDPTQVVDLRGQPLTEGAVEDGAQLVANAFGTPTDLFVGFKPAADFAKSFLSKERIILPGQTSGYDVGVFINRFISQFGAININPDVFLGTRQAPVSATNGKAPAAPTITAGALTGTTGDWAKSSAGTYKFAATLGNQFGESAVSASIDVVIGTADLTKLVPLTITNGTVVADQEPEWVAIYRSEAGGTKLFQVERIAINAQNSGGVTTFNDNGNIMSDTFKGFIGEMTPQVLTFRQLAPMMKMDLAIIAPAYRWMILLYGMPILFIPRRWVRYINIGRLSA